MHYTKNKTNPKLQDTIWKYANDTQFEVVMLTLNVFTSISMFSIENSDLYLSCVFQESRRGLKIFLFFFFLMNHKGLHCSHKVYYQSCLLQLTDRTTFFSSNDSHQTHRLPCLLPPINPWVPFVFSGMIFIDESPLYCNNLNTIISLIVEIFVFHNLICLLP